MDDTSDPKQKKANDELRTSVPIPETTKLSGSGCTTAVGIAVAIVLLLVVVAFGLFVGACWR